MKLRQRICAQCGIVQSNEGLLFCSLKIVGCPDSHFLTDYVRTKVSTKATKGGHMLAIAQELFHARRQAGFYPVIFYYPLKKWGTMAPHGPPVPQSLPSPDSLQSVHQYKAFVNNDPISMQLILTGCHIQENQNLMSQNLLASPWYATETVL